MKVDTPYLIAGVVGLLAVLGGLAFWIWGGSATDTPTDIASGECVPKETFEVAATDYTLGKADAPITIIEYASMTCIHCARFSRDVLPLLKENYIDKGYVRYVFREFPLDQVALTASVVGRCLQKDAYIPYIELMYHELETWARQENLRDSIKEMARRAGMSGDDFEKCLSSEEDAKKIVAAQAIANKDYCISGTPTFLMNGKKLAGGEIPWPEMDEKLRAELKAKGVTPPPAAAAAPAEGTTPAEGATPAPAEGAAAPADGATPPAAAPAEGAAPASGAATPPATTPPASTPATTPAPASGTPNP